MDYKKKLKSRLYVAIIYLAIGVIMIVGSGISKTENDFISSFGLVIIVMGTVRIRNYFMITKTEERIRKQEITETDERNLAILNRAKSAAFAIYLLLSGTAVIILSLFAKHEAAKWISYSVLLLVAIYWGCYFVYRKKL